MNFFQSVFSDEPQNPRAEKEGEEEENPNPGDPESPTNPSPDSRSGDSAMEAAGFGGWNFGSLIKTITARSEQVIKSYRRDLDEFRVGLTQEARVVAANLPATLESGASVAQESLESVGEAIDVVFKSTADLISQALENPAPAVAPGGSNASVKKFSRFEMQLHAIQNDHDTYSEDPDDVDEFIKWRSGFSMEEKADEIEQLCEENSAVGGFFRKLVPKNVDVESFWARYFFRVHKLKQVEEARAHLVKRVISKDEDDDLSWEIDDDDAAESSESKKNEVTDSKGVEGVDLGSKNGDVGCEKVKETSKDKDETRSHESPVEKKLGSESMVENKNSNTSSDSGADENGELSGELSDGKSNESGEVKEISDEKTLAKEKADAAESSKDSDFSVVSCQTSVQEEDDIGWDEIEDLGGNDEKKTATSGGSLNKVDIRKRLNAAEDDEDLSWDIEDDEDVKS